MALTKISTGGVKDDAVGQNQLADNSVVLANLTNDCVDGSKIADEAIAESRLEISNAGTNGHYLQKQSGNTGGLTWATVTVPDSDKIEEGNTSIETVDTGSDGHVKITTEGTERVRVIADGNVGIGTTDPQFTVDVNGELASKNASKEFIGLQLTNNEARIRSSFYSGASGAYKPITFFTSDTERMRIHSGGQISKGTTVAREQVHFHYDSSDENYLRFTNSTTGTAAGDGFNVGISSSEQAIIWHKESEALLIGTANTERFRVGSAGQLGIGGATYGTSGQVLTSGGGSAAPTWADAAGGGATPTVKTANYTAASGDLVVVNGSGLTITLPSSPSVADSVEIRILGSRYCTVARNGQNIESTASDFYIDTFDGHTKFIYTDSTRGWLVA